MIKSSQFLTTCFLLFVGMLPAQNSACVEHILDFQEKTERWLAADYAKTVHLAYSVKVVDAQAQSQLSQVEFYRKGLLVHLFSDDLILIQDEEEQFLVVLQEQLIIRKKQSGLKVSQGSIQGLKTFRAELLQSCRQLQCQSVQKHHLIDLEVPQGTEGVDYLTRMRYQLPRGGGSSAIIESWFRPGYHLSYFRQHYQVMDGDVSYDFGPSARHWFFTASGQLKPEFRSYQFIDEEN